MIRLDRKTDCAILDRLEKRYSAPHWVFLRELRDDTGFQSTRACDALAIGIYHSRGQEMIGFEKKISRADWLRELREPAKAEAIAQYCDRWYVVVNDKDIVRLEEMPSTWGLMFISGNKLTMLQQAPQLTPRPISRGLLAAIIERSIEQAVKPYQVTKEVAKAGELAAEFERGKKCAERELEVAERLRANVKAFEEASGLHIDSYFGGRELGERVKAVRQKDRYIDEAERTVKNSIEVITNRVLPALREFLTPTNSPQTVGRLPIPSGHSSETETLE